MERPGRRGSLRASLATGLIACLTFGCVWRDFNAVERARTEYEDCQAERAPGHAECVALHEHYLDLQRRYEENARRAWSCDPQSEECPTPR